MGTRVGHILPGLGFIFIGLWHLYNHIKLYCQQPKRYKPPAWFPAPRVRHLELYLLVLSNLTYLITENIIGPSQHYPLDPTDWSIPTSHLHNFEHSVISLAFLIYGAFALRIDRVRPRAGHSTMELLVGAATFVAEFLMFNLHSTDHSGIEWQYHWLLQTIIAVSLVTTLLGIGHPRSFAVGFTRSVSILFQGIWFNVTGIMLYTPKFAPKGCHVESDEGFFRVPCDRPASLHRGKGLVNLQFAGSFAAVSVFSAWFYLRLANKYPEVPEHDSLGTNEGQEDKFLQSSK